MEQGKGLKHQPTFGFYSKEELIQLIHACDLYVHASVIEIEAISCMEAFSCGLVPVICDSDRSATPQFAIDDRSLFKPDDSKDLAQKIDYWITHPMERERMSKEYASQGDRYRVEQSILEAEKMFQEVITEHAAAKARQ
ncbi:MAG: glycosyltransferase [Bianqueaceae bacterium]